MLRLINLNVPLDYTDDTLRSLLLKKLKLTPDQLFSFHISRPLQTGRTFRPVCRFLGER